MPNMRALFDMECNSRGRTALNIFNVMGISILDKQFREVYYSGIMGVSVLYVPVALVQQRMILRHKPFSL